MRVYLIIYLFWMTASMSDFRRALPKIQRSTGPQTSSTLSQAGCLSNPSENIPPSFSKEHARQKISIWKADISHKRGSLKANIWVPSKLHKDTKHHKELLFLPFKQKMVIILTTTVKLYIFPNFGRKKKQYKGKCIL